MKLAFVMFSRIVEKDVDRCRNEERTGELEN